MKVLIIIPTYNEKENLEKIIAEIIQVSPNYHILIVDDDSPDGTSMIVDRLRRKNKKLFLIKRDFKEGIGPAYIAGFNFALKKNYDFIFQMDADFSHDPKMLPVMLATAHLTDWVIGSRYVKGGNIRGWDIKRKIISQLGNLYARVFLGFAIKDWTSGFSCWNLRVLRKIRLNFDENPNGYAFQIAIKYRARLSGFSHIELPIDFRDRRRGKTKMGGGIINEAAVTVIRLRIMKKNFR